MTPAATAAEPIEKKLNKTIVRLQRGDLAALPVDAFVFYARENLGLGSGYGTAIQMRGGDSIKKELEQIGGIQMGQAVVTTAGQMKAKYIIHACGPKFQEPDAEKKLRACVLSALEVAAGKGLKTLAFPAMGAGFYGVPLDVCSRAMLDVIKSFLQGDASLEKVIICVVDRRDFVAFQDKIEKL